jgi:glycosyltransferase involved in cell wall biosynthesis
LFFKVITLEYLFQLQRSQKIRVILISSVVPSSHSAGQIVLQRHLVDEPNIDLLVLPTEPTRRGLRKLMRSFMAYFCKTCLGSIFHAAMFLWRGRWIDAELPEPKKSGMATVVMTVAHGDACWAAMRYANRYDLPLVTFFHDWWPDASMAYRSIRPLMERTFRGLYRESKLALCVSTGMKEKLGSHPNSRVLYPIPGSDLNVRHQRTQIENHDYRVLYSGNIKKYGPMLMNALEVFEDQSNIRLEVRGNSSEWPSTIKAQMSSQGVLLPYATREEFEVWLETADAFLITQSFDEKLKNQMKTNFPSKLLEFAQFGKPLIIWAPADVSGALWAGETGQALVVDKEDPSCLANAIKQLRDNPAEQKRLGEAANAAADSCFNPVRIQSQFVGDLIEIAEEKSRLA